MATNATISDPNSMLAAPDDDWAAGPEAQQQLASTQGQAAAAGPVATQDADPTNEMVAYPQSQEALDLQQTAHHGRLAQVMSQLGEALGGSTYEVSRGNDGKLLITPRKATPGESWARAGLAAIKGVAAGYAVPNGPGNLGRALAAGAGSGMDMAADARKQQVGQADADFNDRQQAQLHAANMALTNQRTLQTAQQMKRDNVQFMQGQADRTNGIANQIAEGGGQDLGRIDDISDLPKLAKVDPTIVSDHAAGLIHTEPEVDADGDVTGMKVYRMRPDWAKTLNDKSITYQDLEPGKMGEEPTVVTRTIPAHAMTNGQIALTTEASRGRIMQASQTAHENRNKDLTTQSEAQLRGAQGVEARAGAAKDYAEASKARIEANNGNPGDTSGGSSMSQQAQMMVEGRLAPSQLSKRAKQYNELLPLANQYSMQKYGQPYDAEVSESRYRTRQATMKDFADGRPADQISSFNTFLGHAENLSDTIDQLRNTHSPLLNVPLKELRKAMGDARYAAIAPQIEAVRTERENFLNNNHALQAPQIKDAENLLNDNQSLAQAQAAIKSFAGQAVTRVGTLNDRHKRVMGMDAPEILNETSKRTIRKLGLDREAQTALGTAYAPAAPAAAAPTTAAPSSTAAPAAGGFNWGAHPVAN